MQFNIDSYRAAFQGGARQYLFRYVPNFPSSMPASPREIEKASYLVRSTTLPETSTDEITTNWMGFDYKIAGKYTYNDWPISLNVDLDANVRDLFHRWSELIHDPVTNIRNSPFYYTADQFLDLLTLDGNVSMRYKLVGAWPKTIGAAAVDYNTNDVVSFEVTFAYVYHIHY